MGDDRDLHIPLLLWWALESKVASAPEAVLALFQDREIWDLPVVRSTITERMMRRFASAGTRQDLTNCARLLALAPGPDHVKRLMAGFEAAYAGRSLAGLPSELVDALARYSRHSLTLGLRQGKPEAQGEALRLLADERADRTKQLQVLEVLGEVKRPECVPVVLRLACRSADNALRIGALDTLAGYDDPSIAPLVLAAYASMSDDVLAAAQNLLAARRRSAAQFLDAIEARTIDPRSVPREVAHKLLVLGDSRISERTISLFGPIKPATSAELHASGNRLAAAIRAGSGVPKPGKQTYERVCAGCHTLFGHGGKVGPDLTTYRRDDLDNMLLSVVNPSAEIREGFATSIVALSDGRVLSGVVVEADKNVVVIRGADGKERTLARGEIDAIHAGSSSIMPEGLLLDLSDQQVRDLFAYLRTTQPLID